MRQKKSFLIWDLSVSYRIIVFLKQWQKYESRKTKFKKKTVKFLSLVDRKDEIAKAAIIFFG